MELYIKNRKRQKTEYQYFMHQFVESCIRYGIRSKMDFMPSFRFHIRAAFLRLLLTLYKVVHLVSPKLIRRRKSLMVTANGMTIMENVFPYFFGYEIIPVLWDIWPYTWDTLRRDLKLLDVKRMFVTVKSMSKKINEEWGIECHWLPEGIDINDYNKGEILSSRKYDILEIGRQHAEYHNMLLEMEKEGSLTGFKYNKLHEDGSVDLKNLAYKTAAELIDDIANFKIMLCFPQVDTNPRRAGNLETLTQRYWEAMLSGCLIVGRAPEELMEIIGYNPVIDVDWKNCKQQIKDILHNIDNYQALVDKNEQVARSNAYWDYRMKIISKALDIEQNGKS